MARIDALTFERQVEKAIRQLPYQISRAPEGPDFVVSNGRNRVVVEVKSYPVLLRPVVEAGRYAHRFNAPAVICVPDRAEVLDSVRRWAEDNNIFVSPIGQVADTLRKLLEAD